MMIIDTGTNAVLVYGKLLLQALTLITLLTQKQQVERYPYSIKF